MRVIVPSALEKILLAGIFCLLSIFRARFGLIFTSASVPIILIVIQLIRLSLRETEFFIISISMLSSLAPSKKPTSRSSLRISNSFIMGGTVILIFQRKPVKYFTAIPQIIKPKISPKRYLYFENMCRKP